MCVCLVSVQLPAHTWSNHLLLMFALGVFLAKNQQNSLLTDLVLAKPCSESQKLGFFRLQDDLPTLLRNLWRMGHLHDGSICCQDFRSFAKILTTHETARRSLHTGKERMILVRTQCTFDIKALFFGFGTRTTSKRNFVETDSCWNRTYRSPHVGRLQFHFLSRNFRRLEDGLPHEATASCVDRYTWTFCHQCAQLPRAVWLRGIFGITFLAFIAELLHLGLDGLSCCNETIELEVFLLQFVVLTLKLLHLQALQMQCECLPLRFFLQALRFTFLLPFSQVFALKMELFNLQSMLLSLWFLFLQAFRFIFLLSFSQVFAFKLKLLHLHSMLLSLWFFFLQALRFIFLLPFSQVFALKLKLLQLQRFFLLQALTFLCQLLHLNVKFILLRVQACLGGCCLIPSTKKQTLKKSQGLLSSFQRWIQIFIIWGSKTKKPIQLKPLLANTRPCSPFWPPLPVGSSKCSHERPWLGASAGPRIKGSATTASASTGTTARPDNNSTFLPSSRPVRPCRWPPEERCELLWPAPRWRRPDPSVAFSRRWIRPKSRAGPARAPGRNRSASGIWRHRPKEAANLHHRTLRFSLPAPSAPRTQDPRVCPGGLSALEHDELTNLSSTSDVLVGLWDNKTTIFPSWGPSFWRNPLRAPNSLHSISKESLLRHHGRNCIQYIHMPIALAIQTQREESAKSQIQEEHEKMRNMWRHCQKQYSNYNSTTTDMQCCMVSTCLSCYWQDLMDWCWHKPTTLLILARLPCL